MNEIREKIKQRFWMDSGNMRKIAELFDKWWTEVQKYITLQKSQIDTDTSPLIMVDLLAWQRDIDRLPGEDETLYRRRVKYALANAKDAGSKAGFKEIWKRLELGDIVQYERRDKVDWDVIELEIDEYIYSKYESLFALIIEKYGRTCRRYVFSAKTGVQVICAASEFNCEVITTIARAE